MGYLSEVVWKDEYKYSDTPDGQDCGKKILYVTKYAGIYALLFSTIDVLAYSHPKGYAAILGRYAYNTFPIMGIAAAATAATCAATNIRHKDDQLNYSIGALAGTAVWGAWRKSFKIGIYGGVAMALLGAVYKDAKDNNWPILSPPANGKRMTITPWNLTQDWTILQDPGRTWKKSVDE